MLAIKTTVLTIQGSWFASYCASYLGHLRWGNCFLKSLSLSKVLSNFLAFFAQYSGKVSHTESISLVR